MGITARGGWLSVQRHFLELGTDVQTEPVRVVGCGDMSGDVFGNGMLLSKVTETGRRFRPSPHLPRSRSRSGEKLGGAQSPFRLAALQLGRLRQAADLERRRGLSAQPQSDPAQPANARSAGHRGGQRRSRNTDFGDPQKPGRSVVVRRHRHLCEGGGGEQYPGRRSGKRCAAGQWRGATCAGDRRGRQSWLHPGRAHRICACRGPQQHRFHRQFRRGRLFRQGSEHQDCAGIGAARRPPHRTGPGQAAHRDDRRCRRAGAGGQPASGARLVDCPGGRGSGDRFLSAADRHARGTRPA